MYLNSEPDVLIVGSGHAGMACGGQGDVLTGVIAGLMGQGLGPVDAARLGAWLCGRAAEWLTAQTIQSAESLLPSDVTTHLGKAFRELSS